MTTSLFTTPTTELQAVNMMLENIGESPVSNLNDAGLGDVAVAKDMLGRVNREVQSRGWSWNTDYNYALARDTNNQVPIPANALEVDSDSNDAWMDVVVRGGFLWDRFNKRFTFDNSVRCRITWLLEFESLPEAARNFIAIKAARQFAKAMLGTEAASRLTQEDEMRSDGQLTNQEARTSSANMLNDSYSASQVLDRDPHAFFPLG